MTDKEIIRKEIEKVKLIIQSNRAQGAFSEGYLIGQESVLEHFEKFVNSLSRTPRFTVGDRIRKPSIGDVTGLVIKDICADYYLCEHNVKVGFDELDDWELAKSASKVWHGAKERPERNMARCAWVCKDGVMYTGWYNKDAFGHEDMRESMLKFTFDEIKQWAYVFDLLKL